MEQIQMQELARAMGVTGTFEGTITEISTDSRALPAGCLFVALAGERFNGHDYIADALKAGAAYAVAHERREYGEASDRILYVQDTQRALMAIGHTYRMHFPIRCVGITGSVGKTTTKDMVAEVVSAGFTTLKTQGNLNNEIGLPKTLLELRHTHQAAVLEFGMQGLGEIADLAWVAKPDVGVITNIGVSHLEQLGTREKILQAKLELADALPDGAPLFLCGDNDLLCGVRIPRLKVQFYGIENPNCTIQAKSLRGDSTETLFTLVYDGKESPVKIPCVGVHNVLNALAAFGVGQALGIDRQTCIDALQRYTPSGMRQKVVDCNGYTVVEDCYNASPDSMSAALNTLASYPCTGKRIAVLGDMLELGSAATAAHTQIGALAASLGIDLLMCYGELAVHMAKAAQQGGMEAVHFDEKTALGIELRHRLGQGDVVWLKASRGMKLEELLTGLYA